MLVLVRPLISSHVPLAKTSLLAKLASMCKPKSLDSGRCEEVDRLYYKLLPLSKTESCLLSLTFRAYTQSIRWQAYIHRVSNCGIKQELMRVT